MTEPTDFQTTHSILATPSWITVYGAKRQMSQRPHWRPNDVGPSAKTDYAARILWRQWQALPTVTRHVATQEIHASAEAIEAYLSIAKDRAVWRQIVIRAGAVH